MSLKTVALLALAVALTNCGERGELEHRLVNKKIFDYQSLHEAVNEAVRRGAKTILICEEETCPFSKLMTRYLKKELKAVDFDSYMLRIER